MADQAFRELPPQIESLRHGWRVIAVASAVALALAFFSTLVLTWLGSTYTSEATVLLTGSKYRLQFDPRFTTVDQIGAVPGVPAASGRVNEFRAVALSSGVRKSAAQTLAGSLDPGDVLPNGELNPGLVDVRVQGTVLTVSASSGSPDKTVRIADAYAAAVAQSMDRVYGTSEQDREALEKQLVEVTKRHEEAEAKLADFLRANRLAELNRGIAQRTAARDTIVNEQINVLKTRVTRYYAGLVEIDRVRHDLEAFRRQVMEAGESGPSLLANSLALVGLETRLINLDSTAPLAAPGSVASMQAPSGAEPSVAGASNPVPLPPPQSNREVARSAPNPVPLTQLQISGDVLVSRNSRQQLLADIDAMSRTLDARQADLTQAYQGGLVELQRQLGAKAGLLATERVATDQPAGALVEQLEGEIASLQASAQDEAFRQAVLAQSVEQAKTARAALELKLQEASIASASGGKAMVTSGATTPAARSFPPPLSRSLPVAAISGALIGAVGALLMGRRRAALGYASLDGVPPQGDVGAGVGANGLGAEPARGDGSAVVR